MYSSMAIDASSGRVGRTGRAGRAGAKAWVKKDAGGADGGTYEESQLGAGSVAVEENITDGS